VFTNPVSTYDIQDQLWKWNYNNITIIIVYIGVCTPYSLRSVCMEVRAVRPWPIMLEHTRARARRTSVHTTHYMYARAREYVQLSCCRCTGVNSVYCVAPIVARAHIARNGRSTNTQPPRRQLDTVLKQCARVADIRIPTGYYRTRSSHHGGRFSCWHRPRVARRQPSTARRYRGSLSAAADSYPAPPSPGRKPTGTRDRDTI